MQNQIAAWLQYSGQLLMFAAFIVCMFDLYGFADRGHLLVPLSGYLTVIFSGVALNVVSSPIKHMEFEGSKKPKPAK